MVGTEPYLEIGVRSIGLEFWTITSEGCKWPMKERFAPTNREFKE
jgi:hypothetical protein